MPILSAFAGELDALVRDGRRIRLGDRNFERPHADLDALLSKLQGLSDRMRLGVAEPANDPYERMIYRGRPVVGISVSRPKKP